MARRALTIWIFALTALVAAAAVGAAVRGWAGAVLFPFAIAFGAVCVIAGLFALRVLAYFWRSQRLFWDVWGRVSGLPTEELRAMAAAPAHPLYGLAVGALSMRGIDTKPPEKGLLLDMLASPDLRTRGQAIHLLVVHYPEVRFPEGCSSADPPEVWRERIESMTRSAP